MAKIAILGFGTVGSGVYEVLCRNAAGVSRRAGEPVEVKYILDPKDFSGHPAAHLFIKNFDTILEDPEIKVVVETIGGTRFAYPYVKACLESGRSVCTSNKEMVATYGAELLGLAKAHNCAFLFEASVGGGTPRPAEPVWFLKPDTALLRNNDPFYIPAFSQQVDYECELVVRINRVGRAISERFAHRYYDEVGLGIDFTARDLQRQAIAEGLPWERCKAFDHSAALSPVFIPLPELGGDIRRLHFTLEVNGQVRQRGDTSEMLFDVDRLIVAVSQQMTLRMGDLLYTGTPAGVGPVRAGDNLRATLEGRELLNFDIR